MMLLNVLIALVVIAVFVWVAASRQVDRMGWVFVGIGSAAVVLVLWLLPLH